MDGDQSIARAATAAAHLLVLILFAKLLSLHPEDIEPDEFGHYARRVR